MKKILRICNFVVFEIITNTDLDYSILEVKNPIHKSWKIDANVVIYEYLLRSATTYYEERNRAAT